MALCMQHQDPLSVVYDPCQTAVQYAGILYTLYGHHLWDRREDILHAVGLAKDGE